MSDSVDRVFVHALNTVKKIPRTGSARPPPEDRLKLYGLYKQSMEGDVDGVMDRPAGDGDDNLAELRKWVAWNQQKGLSKTDAKRRYISVLIETMHKYASNTQDARELVSELEFVWDQIKSNVPSWVSSPPSPPSGSLGLVALQRSSYTETGNAADAGLRVMSPMSQDDEAEIGDETFNEAREGEYDEGDGQDRTAAMLNKAEARNRKWRRRVEQALVKMTVELAAMREQMERQRLQAARRRRNIWAWIVWLLSYTFRHLLVDAALLGMVLLWMRRKGDRSLEHGLWSISVLVRDKLRKLRWR